MCENLSVCVCVYVPHWGVVCPSFRCLLGLHLAGLFGTYLASCGRRGRSSSLVICVVAGTRPFQDCTPVVCSDEKKGQRIRNRVRLRKNKKVLLHWSTLARKSSNKWKTVWRSEAKKRRNNMNQIQADWERSSRGGRRNRGSCWSWGACVWCHSNSIQLLIQASTQEPSTILTSDPAYAQETK